MTERFVASACGVPKARNGFIPAPPHLIMHERQAGRTILQLLVDTLSSEPLSP
jgi:hypothetical protein